MDWVSEGVVQGVDMPLDFAVEATLLKPGWSTWRPGLVARFGPQPHLPERPPDAPLASRLSVLGAVEK